MAKVKFIKDHLRHKTGEVADIIDDRAVYFVRCKVAIYIKDESPKQAKETRTLKSTKAKKAKSKK